METTSLRNILSLFIVICFQCNYVSLFSMLSHDQQYIVDVGSQLTLSCEFYKEHFNLFDNPVQWKKFQYGEETEINILGNIKEPFESTGRFIVSYQPSPPQYTMSMTITEMSRLDSANYTCEVRAPKSGPLGVVHYTVFVKAPVEEVSIVQGNATSNSDTSVVNTVTFVENEPTPVRCIARGGSPPPEMEISVGREDYSKYFRFDSMPAVFGMVGFRTLQMTTMLVTDEFRATAADDGMRLNCIAQVPALPKTVKSALIVVNHAPRFECEHTSSYVGERNVRLTCDVTARPELTSWHWVLDSNGTTVSEGEVIDGYWTVVTSEEGKVHLQLYIRETTQHSFRAYMLVAENSVASQYTELTLDRQYRDTEPKKHASVEENNIPQREKQASRPNIQSSSTTTRSAIVPLIVSLITLHYLY